MEDVRCRNAGSGPQGYRNIPMPGTVTSVCHKPLTAQWVNALEFSHISAIFMDIMEKKLSAIGQRGTTGNGILDVTMPEGPEEPIGCERELSWSF